MLPMSLLETLSLAPIALGAAAILRFVWLDSLRFVDVGQAARAGDPAIVSPGTVQRLALQADAARIRADNEGLPRAA
ncbi:MAG: hypothetical protein ABI672_21310 [Vicinamibacteria bacterium]